ncbi:hypothetical protein K437DRAFT_259766 [Tilletiaria anomala UBC 951]|uniref:Uncharacterized protein n=1 Tax=Tilletiaria anomala (strain ATCC 24038 / CBS 436.72 / UBC 951) TaxID=1037660 RepID=A0A066VG25_TILAU|nr:uncharacterized protein K437DRAFT_259766 [Tilletiaria anomala UBC 951]KDN37530.1 hypothetical protein K437DRAFT_259766 [Tilletiaria anomala UBC 951]
MADAAAAFHAETAATAESLFQSVLSEASATVPGAGAGKNTETTPGDEGTANGAQRDGQPGSRFSARLRGRRLQLSNPDRPMPRPAQGSTQAKSQAKRKQRMTKRWRRALRAEARRDRSYQPTEFDLNPPLSRRPKAGRLSLEDCKAATSVELLEVTHRMWVSYVQDILGLRKATSLASLQEQAERHDQTVGEQAQAITGSLSVSAPTTLSKADLTGATLKVSHSSNASCIGISGIVIQETEQTLMLGTPLWLDSEGKGKKKRNNNLHRSPADANNGRARRLDNYPLVRQISKHNSNFLVMIPVPPATTFQEATALIELELYGNQMKYVLPSRATRKAKQRKTIEI